MTNDKIQNYAVIHTTLLHNIKLLRSRLDGENLTGVVFMNNLEGALIRELKSLLFAKAALEDLSSGNYSNCADALTNLIKVLCYQTAPSSGGPK